ncbi:MAG: Gldg family protein [Planctomycetes bacterium]|nr:Gldg family protein [Planctomycetota bacterium]
MSGRRWIGAVNLLVAALLMLAVWLLLVWVSARPALKVLLDLTPQRIHALDPATEDLVRELRTASTKVEFHLFLPPIEGVAQTDAQRQGIAIRTRLRDMTRLLLRRYQWLGGEAVTIREHDLYTDVERTREAAQRFDFKTEERDVLVVAVEPEGRERRFRKLSLDADLATIELPNLPPGAPASAALPVLKDFKGEATISSALKGLLVQGTPIVYFLRGYSPDLDLRGQSAPGYAALLASLQHVGFEVRELDFNQEPRVPADATMVAVLEPRREFTERDAQVLYDYVRRGGRLFVNYSWAGLPDWNPTGGKLGELFGYELSQSPLFHLIPDVTGLTAGRSIDGPGVERLHLYGSTVHPVTQRLVKAGRPLEVKAARAVRTAGKPDGVRAEDLLRTGGEGWLAGVDPRDGFPDQRRPDQARLGSFTVGLALDVDLAVPATDTAATGAPRSGAVVIVSGVFCNNLGMQQFGDLALNICNWMAERRVLLDIQGARYDAKHLQLQPQQLERVRLLLVYGVPAVFFLLACVVFFVRRRL